MVEIAFYQLSRSRLESALPKLLEKTLAAGKRAVVLTGSAERTEALASALWSYERESWLPHGTAKDGHAADQPIWLGETDINPNKADFLFLTDGARSEGVAAFERVFELFGEADDAIAKARERWTAYRAAGFTVTYWQQGERGWELKS